MVRLVKVYKCRNWTFKPNSQELIYADGKTEQLASRISDCLLTLILAEGDTVTYEELLLKVWGTTHKDASTISSVISEVRKLIGCGKQGKKIIVTLPKRGYRFAEPVEVIDEHALSHSALAPNTINQQRDLESPQDDSSVAEISSSDNNSDLLHDVVTIESTSGSPSINELSLKKGPTNESIVKKAGKGLWVAIAIAALVVTTLLIWVFNGSLNSQAKPTRFLITGDYEVITHDTGREDEFDVSKDGVWLTYVNKAPNVTPSLVVKELATGKVQRLVASQGGYFGSPVFSIDATKIAFHKQTGQHCEVWLADFSDKTLNAGNTKKLTQCGKSGFWSTLAFSNDGNQLYFARANALTDPYKVFRLDLRTGFERSVTSPTSSGRGDYAFSLSPNGEQLAVVRNVLWQQSHIILKNTESGQSQLAFELPYLIDRVAWLDDGNLAYCDKNQTVWSYDITQNQHAQLSKLDFSCGYPVMASNQLFAIKKDKVNNAIWTLKQNGHDEFSVQPLITSPYYDFNAMFGPNNSVYFLSNRSGDEKLWQKTEGSFKQHANVKLPAHARELEFSSETNSFYGISQKRLFRYDLNINEVEWLSKQQHEVFNFSISSTGRLLFSEGNKEYWALKSLDLYTLKITDLNMNAFAAREAEGQLYFTKFHEKGLWQKDRKSGDVQNVIKGIDIKFNTFWHIWNNEMLIWATDNKFKIYDLKTGMLINDEITYQGHVGYLKCDDKRAMCSYTLRENDQSEVIAFKYN